MPEQNYFLVVWVLSTTAQWLVSITENPTAKAIFFLAGGLAALYAIVKGTSALCSWVSRKWKEAFPFKVEACEGRYNPEIPDGAIVFRKGRLNVHGVAGLFLESLTLRITPKEDTKFERIKVELLKKKRLFGFERVKIDEIRIDGLLDVGVMVAPGYKRHVTLPDFSSEEDGVGGYNGHYRPPYQVPTSGYLWLSVGYKVNAWRPPKGEYCIAVRQLSGSSRVRVARMKVVFINKDLEAERPRSPAISSTDQT